MLFRSKVPKDVEDSLAEDEAFNDILERQRREQALIDLHRVSQELGLYDETDGPNRNTSNF